MAKIVIDEKKCIGCGACINACPVSLFKLVEDRSKFVGDPNTCVVCRTCETICPVGAIKVIE